MIRTCVALSLALAAPDCRPHLRPYATDRQRCVARAFPINPHAPHVGH